MIEISRDMSLLHPRAMKQFIKMQVQLASAYGRGETEYYFKPFEAWRHPARQSELLRQKTTKASMWKSAHQYGLAVDFVPHSAVDGWMWEPKEGMPPIDWAAMHKIAYANGLTVPISWDKPHIEHPLFGQIPK